MSESYIKTCTSCSFQNVGEHLFCQQCQHPLEEPIKLTQMLWEKQKQLEARHSRELKALQEQITLLNLSLAQKAAKQNASTPPPVPTGSTVEREKTPADTPKQAALSTPAVERVAKPVHQQEEPNEPSLSFGEWLRTFEWLEPVFAGTDMVKAVYDRYKTEGKLPIFFMTLFGIAALLFGTGYLMQYSLQFMGQYAELIKISGGFVLVGLLLFSGIRLFQKEKKYAEYASALISLALVLNYLMIYFLTGLGNFPLLSSSLTGFLLIVANTGLAIYLALRYETRIVAVIFLIGGALTPFYLDASGDGTLYYLYLWFVTAGAIYIAYSIKWKTLFYLSFVTAYALLEGLVFQVNPSADLFTLYYHLFAYLFFLTILWDKKSWVGQLDKTAIIMLAGNLSFLFFNLYSIYQERMVLLGIIYLANALVFASLLWKFRSSFSDLLKQSITVIIAAFVGLAIPAIFDQTLMGLFWSIEAVMLLIMGFIYRMPVIRKEGYFVLLIAIGKLCYHSIDYLDNWANSLSHEGFLNYLVIGLLFSGLWGLSNRFKASLTNFESTLYAVIKEIVPLWLASVWFTVAFYLFDVWSYNLAILPMFGLIFWQKRFGTSLTALAGNLHLVFFLASYFISQQEVGSLRFMMQTLPAKIAMIEWMASLWLLQKYFELLKMHDSDNYALSQYFRQVFYMLLPLILINFVRRNAIEWIEPAVWSGVLFTYFLYRKLRYKSLLIEGYLLFSAAAMLTFYWNSPEAYGAAILTLFALYFLEKMQDINRLISSGLREMMLPAPYLLSLYSALFVYQWLNPTQGDFMLAPMIAACLFGFLYFQEKIPLFMQSKRLGLVAFIVVQSTGSLFLLANQDILPFVLWVMTSTGYAILLVNKKHWFDKIQHRNIWRIATIAYQFTILTAYLSLLYNLDMKISGPWTTVLLTIHAVILIFIHLKNNEILYARMSAVLFGLAILKVILHDTSDFIMLYKVIVFMALGVLLLSASYVYVRLIKPKQ